MKREKDDDASEEKEAKKALNNTYHDLFGTNQNCKLCTSLREKS